ncbi:hypothetical protein F4680DRAFT_465894 [Xylaria scruposa]|nr:hypothetical protein F4680DRAFT_465894 [Xylaria scruposa]
MSQPAPDSIVRAIASLGRDHLVLEGILTEYCKKPTLVYISFWDRYWNRGDVFPPKKFSPPHQHDFGGVPFGNVHCIIENYKTAFAPLLADSTTRKLYERIRTQRSASTESNRILSLYGIRNAVGKPIDYLFLENFHEANISYPDISLERFVNIPHGPNESQEVDWWPNLVVRLHEFSSVTMCVPSIVNSDERTKRETFIKIFGILASNRVRLQDHLILIDRKMDEERTTEEYDRLKKEYNIVENWMFEMSVKSYDAATKLPNDITFARIEDFDSGQRYRAEMVEEYMAAWNTVPDIHPPKAFFVRWKTDEEKKKEEAELNERLNPSARRGRDSTAPLTLEEEMRCQPVLGITQRLNDYMRSNTSRRTRIDR